MSHTIRRLPAIKTSTGLSRSTIYPRVTQGAFPKPVSLGWRIAGITSAPVQAQTADHRRDHTGWRTPARQQSGTPQSTRRRGVVGARADSGHTS
ncbi:MAG: AlpA family phage regulatory protein [Candidatus Binatia bacterium]